jgi:hypothetical protein
MERTVKQRTMRKSTAVSVQSLRHRARGDLFRYRRHQPRFGDVPGVDRQGARSVVPNDRLHLGGPLRPRHDRSDRVGIPQRSDGRGSPGPLIRLPSRASRRDRSMMAAGRRGPCDVCWKYIDGYSADEIARRKQTAGSQQPGERTGGARQIGSPVELWKPAIS